MPPFPSFTAFPSPAAPTPPRSATWCWGRAAGGRAAIVFGKGAGRKNPPIYDRSAKKKCDVLTSMVWQRSSYDMCGSAWRQWGAGGPSVVGSGVGLFLVVCACVLVGGAEESRECEGPSECEDSHALHRCVPRGTFDDKINPRPIRGFSTSDAHRIVWSITFTTHHTGPERTYAHGLCVCLAVLSLPPSIDRSIDHLIRFRPPPPYLSR